VPRVELLSVCPQALHNAHSNAMSLAGVAQRPIPHSTRSWRMERVTGYYWILFNWPLLAPDREPEWQPAYWDAMAESWALIGSDEEFPEGHPVVVDVGPEIVRQLA
jgi:hypothetical protein